MKQTLKKIFFLPKMNRENCAYLQLGVMGGNMKKTFVAFFSFLITFCIFPGDLAAFVDIGFSEDGKTYLFGEYGKTDKTFQGWAEIYTVDVAKNIFVKNEVYKTPASRVTSGKQGREVYDALAAKNYAVTQKYKCTPVSGEYVLYVCADETKPSNEEIVFNDYTGITGEKSTYRVRLVQNVSGSGKNAQSSFYIMLEKISPNGSVLSSQKIGTPDYVRKSVTGYRIEKIFCNKNATGIVFVVSKTMEDDTGILVRYMVETATLQKESSRAPSGDFAK